MLFAIAALTGAMATQAPTVAESLRAFRIASACSAWVHVAALRTSGTHVDGRDRGTFVEDDDARDGRTLVVSPTGRIPSTSGYDGNVSWVLDSSGAAHTQDATHAIALARTGGWLTRHGWCAPADRTTYFSRGARAERGRAVDLIVAIPKGGTPVKLSIDRASHLLVATEQRLNEETQIMHFSDYRMLGDVPVPFTYDYDFPEDDDLQTFTVRDAAFEARPSDALFAFPKPPNDATISGGAASVRVPYVFDAEKPIVQAMLDGKGPFPMVVDTGGHFILTPATVRAIGAGDGKHGRAFVRRFAIGRATVVNQYAEVHDYRARRIERGQRPPIAGWFGLELLERFAATFDPRSHTITLALLSKPRPEPAGTRLRMTFDQDAPFVDCTIDDFSGPCMIDTANATPTIVEGYWAEHHGLTKRLSRGISLGNGFRFGRADLRFGPFDFPHELVESSKQAADGSESTTVEAGIISAHTTNRFVMTVDLARHDAWFTFLPHAAVRAFDRSGMLASKTTDGDFLVRRVLSPSPAASAGVRSGDRVVTVNGVSASRLSGTDLIAIDTGPIGTSETYRIVRKGVTGTRSVTLRLRELLP